MTSQRQSFSRADKLLNQYDFKHVFDNNTLRASNRFALVLAIASPAERQRLGLVIAKKNVKLAVQRNRVKRLVREHFRCHPTSKPWDLVLIARKGIGELDNEQLRTQLVELWAKLEKRGANA